MQINKQNVAFSLINAHKVGILNEKRFKTILSKIIMPIIHIGIIYYFGLQIYNYSFNIGYNFISSILYLDASMLAKAGLELFQLTGLLFGICFGVAIYENGIE